MQKEAVIPAQKEDCSSDEKKWQFLFSVSPKLELEQEHIFQGSHHPNPEQAYPRFQTQHGISQESENTGKHGDKVDGG